MKKIMYMAVAVIAALSSCSSEEFAENSSNINNNGGVKVFKATIENDGEGTRSTLVGNTANWESTDKVCINGAIYSVAPVEGNAAKATLTYESGTAPTEGDTYKAFYADGANSANYWDSESSAFKLPASYTYADGKFNMPMYAEGTSTELVFKNICGVLAISVPSTAMTSVSTIVVYSDKQMNGAFTATSGGTLTFTEKTLTAVDKKVTLDFNTAVSISDSKTFYLPVPVGKHTLRIEIFAGTTGKYMTTTNTGGVNIEKNTIYNVTFNGTNESKAIDLNLPTGLKWANCIFGATSPEGYGDYYMYGGMEPASSTNPGWAVAPFNDGESDYSADAWAKYKDVVADENHNLLPNYDVIYKTLGGSWRMYNDSDWLYDLLPNTYWEWTDDYNSTGISGFITYKPKNDNDKGKRGYKGQTSGATASYEISDTHIFWPAEFDNQGAFLTSTYDSYYPDKVCMLYFNSTYIGRIGLPRRAARALRGVCQ